MRVRKSARRGTVASLANPRLQGVQNVGGMRSHAGRGDILSSAILKEFVREKGKRKGKGFFPFIVKKTFVLSELSTRD